MLPGEVWASIAAHLPQNDIPTTLRMADKGIAEILKGLQHVTVHLTQPLTEIAIKRMKALFGPSEAADHLFLRRRRAILRALAAHGDVKGLRQLSNSLGCGLGSQEFYAAARAGKLDVCKWLLQQGHIERLDSWGAAVLVAAESGQQAVVEWLWTDPLVQLVREAWRVTTYGRTGVLRMR